jgi:pantoate--beta-alanine ligase
MVIFKKVKDLENYLEKQGSGRRKTGFVPTMGALHKGHLSLVTAAKAGGKMVVCSIFVNPTQFNDKKDLEKYPVSTEDDIEMLEKVGCDVLFLPTAQEVYPGGEALTRTYDFGRLDSLLEGAQRPGHFRGVGQVVGRLLEIVKPDYLYMGQKDYQQCMVVKQLIGMMGSGYPELVICPTTREADGLAMSSRNRRLTDPQRIVAACIYQCLVSIESKQHSDPFPLVRKQCEELLAAKGFIPEYVALADARDLTLLEDYQADVPMVALIAARLGEVRLIDNVLLRNVK